MNVRIALASSDGVWVNEHFGRAGSFLIFGLHDGEWTLLERRRNTPGCSEHSHAEGSLERTAELIGDCRGVVIQQIGAAAFDLLAGKGILPFMFNGTVQDTLKLLKQSKFLKTERH